MSNTTDLHALCLRVWKIVPEVKVVGPVVSDTEIVWPNWMPEHMRIDSIQAKCLRWLLKNVDNSLQSDTTEPPGYVFWVPKFTRYWDTELIAWMAKNEDLTTALLLAVERCHEYKNLTAIKGDE